jgi:hypothetical protein
MVRQSLRRGEEEEAAQRRDKNAFYMGAGNMPVGAGS